MTTVEMQATKESIRRDVKHFAIPMWRALAIAICLILAWGTVWRIIHVELKKQEINRAHESR